MTSYNRVILTGKVATPPRRHYRPDGSPVIQFPLELDDPKDPSGQAIHHNGAGQGDRSLIDIVAFGELAEFKFDLLQSGQHLLVEGRLNQRHWQTPEGKKRTLTEVIATDLRKLEELNQTTVCPAYGRQTTGKMGSTERGEKNEETC
jgi:single-strand DNA-binding protein